MFLRKQTRGTLPMRQPQTSSMLKSMGFPTRGQLVDPSSLASSLLACEKVIAAIDVEEACEWRRSSLVEEAGTEEDKQAARTAALSMQETRDNLFVLEGVVRGWGKAFCLLLGHRIIAPCFHPMQFQSGRGEFHFSARRFASKPSRGMFSSGWHASSW